MIFSITVKYKLTVSIHNTDNYRRYHHYHEYRGRHGTQRPRASPAWHAIESPGGSDAKLRHSRLATTTATATPPPRASWRRKSFPAHVYQHILVHLPLPNRSSVVEGNPINCVIICRGGCCSKWWWID